MANTKQVHFEAYVPFNWPSNLTAREAKCWAAWLLGPSTGLRLKQVMSHYEDNDNGGRTAMYHLSIRGTEAVSESVLVILAESLRKQKFAEVKAYSRDLTASDNEEWYEVRTAKEQSAAERAAKRHVEEMLKGKHWETTVISEGVTEMRLVPDDEAA